MKALIFFLLLPIVSFGQKKVEVEFEFTFNDAKLEKDKWYVSEKGDSIQIETVQFFVSQPSKKDKKVSSSDVQIVDWTKPQSCKWDLQLSKSGMVEFKLGLDSIYHVSSIMDGDLDPSSGLYWAWQSGYIQMKIEGVSPSSSARKNKFQFHLGGYLSPFSVVQNIAFGKIEGKKFKVNVKLDHFFKELDVSESTLVPGKEALALMTRAKKMFYLSRIDD